MKKLLSYTALIAAGMMVFASCEKQADRTAEYTTVEDKAFIRVIHASPSFRQVFNAPDSINLYVNNVKVNGPLITYGGFFPAAATTGFGYFAVPAGLQTLKVTVAGRVNPDSIQLALFTNLALKGQRYSVILTDDVKSARDSSKMILPDNIIQPNTGNYRLRFVNAIVADTAGTTVSIFSARRNGNIFNSIAPGQVVDFQTLPFNSQLSDTLYVRRPGSTFNLAVLNGASFGNQRSYTMIYRGYGGTVTTGTKGRTLVTYLDE